MSDMPKFVQINEEVPREGFQIEKGPIPTARKVELIDALSETGLTQIQIVSFVNPLPHCWQNPTRSPASVACPSGPAFRSPDPGVSCPDVSKIPSLISLTLPSRSSDFGDR